MDTFLGGGKMTIYDLSLEIYPGMPVFPGTLPVSFVGTHTIERDGYTLGQAVINTHAGTHTDAPSHFLPHAPGLEGINLNAYIGSAVIVNCTGKKAKEGIGIRDFVAYEQLIEKNLRVLVKTGWSDYSREPFYYTDYPVIESELAEWLVDKGVILLGVETPSLNPAEYIGVHKTLLRGNVAIIEGIANLDDIESNEIFFFAPPIRFRGADGMPVRAIAIDFSA